jgi:hypothetical protein
MVLVTGNWKLWMAGMDASLIIFAVVFFAVIKPDQNTANQAIKTGLQQSQQAINQASKQLKHTGGAGAAAGQAQLSKAARLTACVSKAGTDPTKLQACQTKFAG